MKVLQNIVEVEEEGLLSLIGQNITLLCMNYIYTGKLVGVNSICVKLEDPAIVYETGSWNTKGYRDSQKLPSTIYVFVSAIESFGTLKG